MTSSDITKKLDGFIKSITDRNKVVQEKKKSGSPVGWIVGIVLALVSLIGIGVAMWLASRRAKELAKLKTKVEQDKVDQDQQAHEAKKEPSRIKREQLISDLKKREREIQERAALLKRAEEEHEARKKKVDGLNAWSEINET